MLKKYKSFTILVPKLYLGTHIYSSIIIILLLSFLRFHCTHQKLTTPVYQVEDTDHGINSYIMSGNYLDLTIKSGSNTLLSLNPGRISSKKTSAYYVLNLVYISETDSLIISTDNELELTFDQNVLKLKSYDVQINKKETVAFFEIDPYDIVDIANAKNVSAIISTGNGTAKARFSRENIHNFKRFSAKYILLSEYEPRLAESPPADNWGFISPGAGTGYEFWLGKYTRIFTEENGNITDYISIGTGYSSFDFDVLGIRQFWIEDPDNPMDSILAIRYWVDEQHTKNYPYIGFMYGISENTIIKNWSFELGVTLQYFFLPEWQGEVDSIYIAEKGMYYPTQKYQLGNGNLFDGFSAGIFLQIGGIWARVNTKKSWAAGLALPLPWW